jgi:DNA-binding transcriptional MerR regulator
MNELIKIKDMTGRYDVSARTLRYYEDMGLIASTRSEDYAYRLYDEAAVKRLEQVLILRKLNVSIKDIQRIFNTPGSNVVLEVLAQKVTDIDEEVALLHELKEIVIAFIRQIEQADFSRDADVKLLYDRAKEIETQLVNADYRGNPSAVHRLFEVTEKLEAKAVSRLQIPDNVLKRMLRNVYFILGSSTSIAVADELGRRYGIFVYHTCEHRLKHSQNADPQFQPGLCLYEENIPNYFERDPEVTRQKERDVVHDYTPMVIMDLIQLSATHEKVICENDIDIESIRQIATHVVTISDDGCWDWFLKGYENAIRQRDISEDEKERLVRKLNAAWGEGKPENPRGTMQYGVKQIFCDDHSAVEQTADEIAEYFGLKAR